MKKFILIGGESRLGSCFKSIYPNECIIFSKKQCDITSLRSVERVIKSTPGKYVLNCAAITDIERCEKNPKECFITNAIGVYILNRICLKLNKKLIHISSDYAESPLNTYGWSKKLSEEIIDGSFLTVRTNFYSIDTFAVNELLNYRQINAYSNIFFNPISINRLVREIYEHKDISGITNFFSQKKISYYEFARIVSEIFNLKKYNLVKQTQFANLPNRATRPLISYIKPDIRVEIKKDLKEFKKFINK